jgi:RNA polymerase sigma factor (sigma-70 family)
MRLQRFSEQHDVRQPRALLFTIANNLAFDHLAERRKERLLIQDNDGIEEVPDTTTAPPRAAELEEAVSQMNKAINALPPRLQEVWFMRHVEDMPFAEIARELDISVDAVEQRLRRATIRLRQRLARLGIDDLVRS